MCKVNKDLLESHAAGQEISLSKAVQQEHITLPTTSSILFGHSNLLYHHLCDLYVMYEYSAHQWMPKSSTYWEKFTHLSAKDIP